MARITLAHQWTAPDGTKNKAGDTVAVGARTAKRLVRDGTARDADQPEPTAETTSDASAAQEPTSDQGDTAAHTSEKGKGGVKAKKIAGDATGADSEES